MPREVVRELVNAAWFQNGVVVLVIVNAITLGLETFPPVMRVAGGFLSALDRVILVVFVGELLLKAFAHGRAFFRSGWNWFDAIVIAVAVVPSNGALAAFRALRVLRILRLVSAIPKLRMMAETLVRTLPGLGAIGTLLTIFFYVFGVVATKLFGATFPQWFGSLWTSMFSLFQIMTLEGWSEIARAVMAQHTFAWIFFVAFILLSSFVVLNLFIGLIVKAMEEPAAGVALAEQPGHELAELRREIAGLRCELRVLTRSDRAPAGINQRATACSELDAQSSSAKSSR